MSQLEGWLITALGMAVVFIGLVLCILAINFFNRLARRIKWEGAHSEAEAAAVAAPPAPVVASEKLAPELLAVIAAALEIERRLYLGRQDQRLTLRRSED